MRGGFGPSELIAPRGVLGRETPPNWGKRVDPARFPKIELSVAGRQNFCRPKTESYPSAERARIFSNQE